MSQHIFPATINTGRAVNVVIGYDRPLHGFFLTVTAAGLDSGAMADAIDAGDDDAFYDEAIVYSNLDDVELSDAGGLALDLGYFKEKLSRLGVQLPSSLESELYEDFEQRTGNKVRRYDEAGQLVPVGADPA
jgi:hypothetical protein